MNYSRFISSMYKAATSAASHDEFVEAWQELLDRGAENFSNNDREEIEAHFENALGVIDRMLFWHATSIESADVLDAQIRPSALIDRSGRLLDANSAWRNTEYNAAENIRILSRNRGDSNELMDKLRSLHAVADRRALLWRTEAPDGSPTIVTIRRVPVQQQGDEPRYLLSITGEIWNEHLSEFLQEEFELTTAELILLRQINAGQSFIDIATNTGKSRETLKAQSKSIYSKMGIDGREAAVRLVSHIQVLLAAAPDIQKRSRSPATKTIVLNDGRQLCWTPRGAKDGRPVLFLHGISLGHSFSPTFEQLLDENNLTAICVDRPGYGQSDPPRDWRNAIDEWLVDFPEIMSKLGLTNRTPVVSSTGGVLYAMASATRWPSLVGNICAFAAGVPIREFTRLKNYPLQVKIAALTARFSPTALRFMMMSAASSYRDPSKRKALVYRTYGSVESDAAALKDPKTFESVHKGFLMIADGGFDGYVGDCLLMFNDWSAYIEGLNHSVRYVNGSNDPVCPVSWARELAEEHTSITVAEVHGAGQLLLHTHPHESFEQLKIAINLQN